MRKLINGEGCESEKQTGEEPWSKFPAFTCFPILTYSVLRSQVSTDPECRSRLRQDSAIFSDAETESKICDKPDPVRSHLLFSAVAGVGMAFINIISQAQIMLNFGCIDGCQSLNKTMVFKFEKKFGPRFKLFGTGA